MYLVREAKANGPRCTVWPPKPLYRGLTTEQFVAEIESALNDYADLGRPIYPQEWEIRTQQLLAFYGEKSVAAFERKKKDLTIRQNISENSYSLFDGAKGTMLSELNTLYEVANKISELLGPPATPQPDSVLA